MSSAGERYSSVFFRLARNDLAKTPEEAGSSSRKEIFKSTDAGVTWRQLVVQ